MGVPVIVFVGVQVIVGIGVLVGEKVGGTDVQVGVPGVNWVVVGVGVLLVVGS
jgi:hypothetical protein